MESDLTENKEQPVNKHFKKNKAKFKDYERRQEKKKENSQKPNSRVLFANCQVTDIFLNIIRQLDPAYAKFKLNLGEPGTRGISFEDGAKVTDKLTEAAIVLNDLAREINEKVGFRYRIPDELKEICDSSIQEK